MKRRVTLKLKAPHAGQQHVLDNAKQFNAVTCGRRWGKTEGIGINRAVDCAVRGYPVGWFAPTYKMLADSWRACIKVLKPLIRRRDLQEHRLELIGGGSLDFWTLDTPDAGRGRKYKRVIIDEAAMVKELKRSWQAAILPTLSDLDGDAWLLTTPRGYDDYYDLTLEFAAHPLGATFRMPTKTNPYIKASTLRMIRQVMSKKYYAQEYEASFESLANRVLHAFDYEDNVVDPRRYPVPDSGPLFVGLDFNVNPMTASIAFPLDTTVKDEKGRKELVEELIFFDEIELHDSGTYELCQELLRRYKHRVNDLIVYPDPTGHARQTSAKKGVTNFTIIEDAGLKLITAGVTSPEDKINEINALACSASGRRRLKVWNKCRKLITSFEQYCYKEGTSILDKGKYDHFVDGVGNITHAEYPLVVETYDEEDALGI